MKLAVTMSNILHNYNIKKIGFALLAKLVATVATSYPAETVLN